MANVPNSVLQRVRGFIGMFANQCATCVRKSAFNCANCDIVNRAKMIMFDLNNLSSIKEEKYFVDNEIDRRYVSIIRAIKHAKRPLPSNKINIKGISRALKCYTLKKMCKCKLLASSVNDKGHYEFYITDNSEDFLRRCVGKINNNKQ